jgi:hypothetical protein
VPLEPILPEFQNQFHTVHRFSQRKASSPRHWNMTSMLRRLAVSFPPQRPGFNSRLDHMGFVVNEVTLGQVFSEYFSFP